MNLTHSTGLFVALALAASTPSPDAQICAEGTPEYELVPLAGLSGNAYTAIGLNDAGQVAGRLPAAQPGGAQLLYVWQDGVLTTRAVPDVTLSVTALSEGGIVAGSLFPSGGGAAQGFAWESATDQLHLFSLDFEPAVMGVNDELVVVGSDLDNLFGFAHDILADTTDVIAFGVVPEVGVGTMGTAAINAGGTAVGAEVVFDEGQGFFVELPYRWTEAGGIEELETLVNGFGGRAVDVSPGGQAAGTYRDEFFAHHAALWTNGGDTLVPLGSPFGFFVSDALALNDHDQVVVVAPNDFFGYTRGFVWKEGVYTDLSCFTPPGLFVARPLDINDGGEILVQLTDSVGLVIVGHGILRPTSPQVGAQETLRAGEPANPLAFLPGVTSGPLLGSVWDPVIDHTTFVPNAAGDFLLLAGLPANLSLPPLGTLLCDPGSQILIATASPGVAFALPIPADPVLLGLSLCSQGASLNPGGIHLANAIDLKLGNI